MLRSRKICSIKSRTRPSIRVKDLGLKVSVCFRKFRVSGFRTTLAFNFEFRRKINAAPVSYGVLRQVLVFVPECKAVYHSDPRVFQRVQGFKFQISNCANTQGSMFRRAKEPCRCLQAHEQKMQSCKCSWKYYSEHGHNWS